MIKRRQVLTQVRLADRLGILQAAVSMALRDDPRLPEAARARVRAAAEAAGYRPQSAGSLLASRRRGI